MTYYTATNLKKFMKGGVALRNAPHRNWNPIQARWAGQAEG